MSIEVNNSNAGQDRSIELNRAKTKADARPERRADAKTEVAGDVDSVEISRDAHSLRQLQTRLEQHDSFDQARVDAIREAIRDGRYPIDHERLANRFLELEKHLNQ